MLPPPTLYNIRWIRNAHSDVTDSGNLPQINSKNSVHIPLILFYGSVDIVSRQHLAINNI